MEKNKNLLIKVPVYVSQETERECGCYSLFQTDNASLINDVKSLISSFNDGPLCPLMINKRAKTTAIGINKIEPIDIEFNKDDCLLLKVTAYKTNLIDGYYHNKATEKDIRFNIDDKLCSDTYFFILYPQIDRKLTTDKLSYYWHVFIYEDPSKESADMTSIARKIMKDIIKIPIRNVKSDKLLADLKKYDLISQVEITLSSFSDDSEEDIPAYLRKYSLDSKMKKERKIKLENMAINDAIMAFEDESFIKSYSRRQLKFFMHNKRTFSLIQEFKDKLSSTLEESFNYDVEVDENSVKNKTIFQVDSIKKNVEGIFKGYMYTTRNE